MRVSVDDKRRFNVEVVEDLGAPCLLLADESFEVGAQHDVTVQFIEGLSLQVSGRVVVREPGELSINLRGRWKGDDLPWRVVKSARGLALEAELSPGRIALLTDGLQLYVSQLVSGSRITMSLGRVQGFTVEGILGAASRAALAHEGASPVLRSRFDLMDDEL